MPKWIKTHWFSVNYGWKHEKKGGWISRYTEHFFTPQEELQEELNSLIAYLDSEQYTIKAVTPMTQGLACYDFYREIGSRGGSGYGWGYGVSPITGFIVLAQQEREVSFEEYDRLLSAQRLKKTLPLLKEKFDKLQQEIDAEKGKVVEISEKKILFGKVKYFIDKKEFSSRETAEVALVTMHQENSAKISELKEIQAQIERIEDEIKDIEV